VAEGLVLRIPGRGTFAVPSTGRYLRHFGSIEDLMALSADSEMQIASPLTSAVNPSAASRLRLSDDAVATLVFLRLHESVPFSHTQVSLPPWVGAKLGDVEELMVPGATSRLTIVGLLDQRLQSPIRDADQSISVASASAEVATALGVAPGSPLLRIDRTYSDTEGTYVQLGVSHFHPERYTYRVRLRRSPS